MAIDTLIGLRNGDEQITLNFEIDSTGQPFPGYHLISYLPMPAPIEAARNASLYTDGSTIVNYKAGNVVETLVINIVGKTVADAFDKLRALERWVWSARDYHTNPNNRYPSHIWISPRTLSVQSFAVVYNAQINETTQSGRASVDQNTIKGVTITFEREAYWRDKEPVPAGFANYFTFGSGGNSSAFNRHAWGALAFDGGATNLQLVPGDVPAFVRLAAYGINGQNMGNFIVGYKSQKRDSIPSAFTPTTTPIVHEAENFTKVDTTHVVDLLLTTASPYPASTAGATARGVNECSPMATRISANIGIDIHTYRVFARMKLSGVYLTEYVSVQMAQGGVGLIGPPVSVVNTNWTMFDMGIVSPPISEPPEWSATPYSATISIEVQTEHINITGIGIRLDIDCFVLIPCDEYYIHNTSPSPALYNNINVPPYDTDTVGQLLLPPGKGQLYWLAGDAQFANYYDPTTDYVSFVLGYNARYGSVRGT